VRLQTISQNGWHQGAKGGAPHSLKLACRRPNFPARHDDFTRPHHHNVMVWWSESCINPPAATQRQDLWPRMVARATVLALGSTIVLPRGPILAAHPLEATHPPQPKKDLAKSDPSLMQAPPPTTKPKSSLSSFVAPAGKKVHRGGDLRAHKQIRGRQAQLGFEKCGHETLGEWEKDATGRGATHRTVRPRPAAIPGVAWPSRTAEPDIAIVTKIA